MFGFGRQLRASRSSDVPARSFTLGLIDTRDFATAQSQHLQRLAAISWSPRSGLIERQTGLGASRAQPRERRLLSRAISSVDRVLGRAPRGWWCGPDRATPIVTTSCRRRSLSRWARRTSPSDGGHRPERTGRPTPSRLPVVNTNGTGRGIDAERPESIVVSPVPTIRSDDFNRLGLGSEWEVIDPNTCRTSKTRCSSRRSTRPTACLPETFDARSRNRLPTSRSRVKSSRHQDPDRVIARSVDRLAFCSTRAPRGRRTLTSRPS